MYYALTASTLATINACLLVYPLDLLMTRYQIVDASK